MSTEVRDNPAEQRFEITVDGAVAGIAVYHLRDDQVIFLHTEVDESYKGQGLGGTLAAGALDAVRARGGKVVPRCPFIKAYIERNPSYQDLVA